MQKSDLVEAVVNVGDLSARQADDVVAILIEQITNALSRGETVNLIGFGSFVVRERAARVGRHPQTGEAIDIAASQLPAFKPGKKLKDSVAKS